MGILQNFISGEYAVCYRLVPENGGLLFQNQKTAFQVIANSKRYWYADPMLFEHEGRHTLFFEAYDKRGQLGRIACCDLKDDGTHSEIQLAISEDFHLSYPNVFKLGGKIYMIPETADANQVLLYECVEFPCQWQRAAVLMDGIKSVDSTFFELDGKRWLFSAELDKSAVHGARLNLYQVAEDFKLTPHAENPVEKNILTSRPAGNIFHFNSDIIRPSQDCSGGVYGRALLFNKISRLDRDEYIEQPVFTVLPRNIQTNIGKKLTGCHTYALSGNHRIEAVDVKYNVVDIMLGIKITVYNLLKKLRLVQ